MTSTLSIVTSPFALVRLHAVLTHAPGMIDAVRIPYSLDASSSMLLQYNIASALKQVLLHMLSNDAVITCHYAALSPSFSGVVQATSWW